MHRLLVVCLAVAALPRAAWSQKPQPVIDASVDLGGAVLRQPGLADASVFTAAGQYRFATPVAELTMNGIGALTPDRRYTGQGIVGISRYAAPGGSWRWELSAGGSAFGLSNAGPAFGWQAFASEHYGTSLGGAFVGAGGGQLAQNGIWTPLLTAHVGGFLTPGRGGRDELSAALAETRFGPANAGSTTFRFADGVAYWIHHADEADLSFGGGARITSRGGLTSGTWGSASVALWLTDHTALVVAGGRALEDVTRGVPSVRYLSVSIRLGARSGDPRLAALVRRARTTTDAIGRVEVRATGDSSRLVAVHYPAASTVELVADFTDWQPVALSRLPNGSWSLECVIAPGTHRVAVRVDGGEWMVPPNLPRVKDEFGGEVGLLIVP